MPQFRTPRPPSGTGLHTFQIPAHLILPPFCRVETTVFIFQKWKMVSGVPERLGNLPEVLQRILGS